jgi:hypothetical protein
MLSSELFRTVALGLVIGGLGGLAVPGGRRTFARYAGPALGIGVGGALIGGFVAGVTLGPGFRETRLALAGLVSALLVCGWTLYQRERRLPR